MTLLDHTWVQAQSKDRQWFFYTLLAKRMFFFLRTCTHGSTKEVRNAED